MKKTMTISEFLNTGGFQEVITEEEQYAFDNLMNAFIAVGCIGAIGALFHAVGSSVVEGFKLIQ
jgi:hypothetical protein